VVANRCQFWECGRPIRPDHFLCYDHFQDLEEDLIDQCPSCKRFKNIDYSLCLECHRTRQAPPRRPASPNRYERESSPQWEAGDAMASEFYVYILRLDGGQFYAGQTRDLRARLMEHREGGTSSTAGRNPKLAWFDIVPTRDEATSMEVRLKDLIDRNPREIRKMFIRFNDLLKEVDH